ncbi:hypothetical protein T11_4070 [Trichinella zimbabwensis]|uniref:Uncharacterized protein n=1 Tax=Trichinella zimbabwensis TaxID=268475 RepID=A0A0V1EVP0_9BILA|nr:hypothetical protein T11_4070 [Trichinella zimbabwensis]
MVHAKWSTVCIICSASLVPYFSREPFQVNKHSNAEVISYIMLCLFFIGYYIIIC